MMIANRTERRKRRWRNLDDRAMLADQIVNLQEYVAQLEHERIHDDLCPDLLNRKGFDEAAAELQHRVQDGDSRDYWVGVVDLDNFKSINDNYGHAFGDLVIQAAGARLAELAHRDDCIARLGGDEFGLLLSGAGLDGINTAHYADDLKFSVDHGVDGRPIEPVTVTMSIGIAAYNPWVPLASTQHAADLAMYEAKKVKGFLVIHSSINGADVQDRPLHRVRDQRHHETEAA
ncbi:GGDEF domain-containing protein [Glycomyces sp. YM15]|uniref:GGDEF domain-containing protein n=1 Tax=Glycomyces sp. YM15 TaxID=2800446 RepID=UPI001965243B|nr:GGDEF domain-containing protein [Glycomyces sp. YM15]